MYLEEAAFISEQLFFQVVVPLLEVNDTALIAISTPESSENYYSILCDMRLPDGSPLFATLRIGMVCDSCMANSPNPAACTHREAERPDWKSTESSRVVKSMYGARNTLLLRESMGMMVSDGAAVFSAAWIHRFTTHRVPLPSGVDYVFVACDPNGGGSSDTALVSAVRKDGYFTVRHPRAR